MGIESASLSDRSPLFGLIVVLAFVIEADDRRAREEKAKLMTLLGKAPTLGMMSEDDMRQAVDRAFDVAGRFRIEEFLEMIKPELTFAQRLSIYANAYETALVDGTLHNAEVRIFRRIEIQFDIDPKDCERLRRFVELKDDIALFTEPDHPMNGRDFRLG